MSLPADINDRYVAAAVKAEGASEIMRRFANAPVDQYIDTEAGPLPSMAEWLRLNEQALGGVPGLTSRVNTLEAFDDGLGIAVVRSGGSPAADLTNLQAAIATGKELYIPLSETLTIDNTGGVGLTIPANGVRIKGRGQIVALGDAHDMIRSTGADFWLEGVRLQGPGTYRPDLGGSGEPPALVACRGADAVVARCKMSEPFGAGIFVRGARGAGLFFNEIESSYAGSIAAPFLFQVYLRVAADTIVYGNTCNGSIQGICGGGDGSGAITVTSKRGVTFSNLTNTLVTGNTCVNQLDHSIYFSNNTDNTTVQENNELTSANDLIKIEGGPNLIKGNRGTGGSAITGRNVFKTIIADNIMTTTLSSATAYGILLYEQVFKRSVRDVTIRDNQLTHLGAESKGGIYVLGDVWDGYQSVIKNLKIKGNTVVGYGATSEGFGIGVRQNLFPGSPVTGDFGENIDIENNIIEFPAHAVPTYGIELSYGLRGGSVKGNTIKGFRSVGCRLLGVQDFNNTGNTLIGDPAASGLFGFNERAKDTTLHYNSQGNLYGQNVYKGTFGRRVQHSDETCFNADRVIVRRTAAAASDSVLASLWPYMYVFTNMNAGAVITLDISAASPWPLDKEVTIVNAGANSFTVNPGAFVVAAGTRLTLVCAGANTFIKA